MTFVPTIVLNGQQFSQRFVRQNFKRQLCNIYKVRKVWSTQGRRQSVENRYGIFRNFDNYFINAINWDSSGHQTLERVLKLNESPGNM